MSLRMTVLAVAALGCMGLLRPAAGLRPVLRRKGRGPKGGGKGGGGGGKQVKKGDLPTKVCATCGRPFTWRKKWEAVWDEVRYCSDRCRNQRRRGGAPAMMPAGGEALPRRQAVANMGLALSLGLGMGFGAATPALAKPRPPPRAEVERALEGVEWDEAWPYTGGDFARLDSEPDTTFYTEARFVQHVDDAAVAAMRAYYDAALQTQLLAGAGASQKQLGDLSVLDLCASWTSHLPPAFNVASKAGAGRVSGLGMNAAELKANEQLNDWVEQDLNVGGAAAPRLPYPDGTFDAVLCSLSVDYLTRPREVFAEVARVLRPGGAVHIVFGDRLFITKAVALWTGKDAVEHAYTVASYLHYASAALGSPEVAVLRDGQDGKDPLYAVRAVRKA